MEWKEYVKSILENLVWMDQIKIRLPDEECEIFVPTIINSSIQIVDEIINSGNNKIVIVFPEKRKLSFLFALIKLIKDIYDGDVLNTYDPHNFRKGQRLKIENCIVEFDKIAYDSTVDYDRIFIKCTDKCSDLLYGIPVKYAPFLQKTDSKRPLSKYKSIIEKFSILEAIHNYNNQSYDMISLLRNYRTHMSSTLFYISQISNSIDMLSNTKINNELLDELLLIGKLNCDGNIEIIGSGQFEGVATFVIGHELYSVKAAIDANIPVRNVIVDISSSNAISSQLDVIDELISYNFPVIFITDTANSFELQSLKDRGFDIWRWNKDNIMTEMKNSGESEIDNKVTNCMELKIEYIECENDEINLAVKMAYFYKNQMDLMSANMRDVLTELFSLSFIALRSVKEYHQTELDNINNHIYKITKMLEIENRFINPEMYSNLINAIDNFKIIFSDSYNFSKIQKVKNILFEHKYNQIILIINDQNDKSLVSKFWNDFITSRYLDVDFLVLYHSEYLNSSYSNADLVIVCGWLSNVIMRRILYSYINNNYMILLNNYEKRWQKPHLKMWHSEINDESNNRVIEKIVSITEKSIDPFVELPVDLSIHETDEIEQLEVILRESKFNQYINKYNGYNGTEIVSAIPVSFVGDRFSFYKLLHKVVTVDNLISGEITIKLPEELVSGDFVVIRETQHDIIIDIADKILMKNNQKDCRKKSAIWKEVLDIEMMFSSEDDIIHMLNNAGCTKNSITIHNWLTDDDMIMPQDIQDLKYIAKAFKDDVLTDLCDEVFEAGKAVKYAHKQAGKHLSQLLKKNIAEKLHQLFSIDIYNIFEPIILDIEEIGTVNVLKITDIGSKVTVEQSDTNRLLKV